jgi:hypothetical protein
MHGDVNIIDERVLRHLFCGLLLFGVLRCLAPECFVSCRLESRGPPTRVVSLLGSVWWRTLPMMMNLIFQHPLADAW